MRIPLALVATCTLACASVAPAVAQAPADAGLFASVNGTVIPATDYDLNARETFRSKFYHGKPPEAEVEKMLREVGQDLIDRVLLAGAARERGFAADPARVAEELEKTEKRLQKDPRWAKDRERMLPSLITHIESLQRVALLEKQVRQVTPTTEEVRSFYKGNPELFTEPSRSKASLILIRVDPSSPAEAWEEAKKKATELREQILKGGDFAALARAHSGDATAESGGDLGYLHEGMMGGQAEEALKALKPGEVSELVRVLEGEALFRLDGREPAKLQPFDAVAERASKLLAERRGDAQWKAFVEKLRAQANIIIGPAFQKIMALPLPSAIDAAAPTAPGR